MSFNKLLIQTAEFFTKVLAGVAYNMLYLLTRACSRFSNVKSYVDWRCVYYGGNLAMGERLLYEEGEILL